MTKFIAIGGLLLIAGLLYWLFKKMLVSGKWQAPQQPFPKHWRAILFQKVPFYAPLNEESKQLFEFKVQEFLTNVRITGIKTQATETDKLLIAASAVIPIFAFPDWQYLNLQEVLLYPSSFNHAFETEGDGEKRRILGMVGTGYMEGKMILSKQSLHHGFKNETDKRNTAIHEFVHLIDKADGTIDGIPSLLLEKQYVLPWLDLIRKEIEEIKEGDSDIRPYGATNKAEFFAVLSEYFFERPALLKKREPKLYKLLEGIFDQNLTAHFNRKHTFKKIGRNDLCPCKSGEKFKRCCGEVHFG